jgi:hypothetical protein
MTHDLRAHMLGVYRSIQKSLLAWNWDEAADRFHRFCEAHRESIPDWYEDEFLFTGMKLWAADRQTQVLRHFALFFDRALGDSACWSDEAAEPFRLTAEAMAA